MTSPVVELEFVQAAKNSSWAVLGLLKTPLATDSDFPIRLDRATYREGETSAIR